MKRDTLIAAAIGLALVAGACGRLNGGGTGSGGIDHPTGADDLVLRVAYGGGFVPVEYNLRALPGLSLYGDGRMIVEGPVIEIYPGPALPNLQVTRLTEEAVQAILQRAEEAGLLGEDRSFDYPCVADAATTTFTVVADGVVHTTSAYALGLGEEPTMQSDCPGVDVEKRRQLWDFQVGLGDLRSWLPEGSIGHEEPFEPVEMRIYVGPYRAQPDLPQEAVQWPLAQALDGFGEPVPDLVDMRCGVVGGADLDTLLPLAQAANQLTPWVDGGAEHALILRPLIPDEHTC